MLYLDPLHQEYACESDHISTIVFQLLSHLDTGANLGWGRFSLKPFDSFDYIEQKERGLQRQEPVAWHRHQPNFPL